MDGRGGKINLAVWFNYWDEIEHCKVVQAMEKWGLGAKLRTPGTSWVREAALSMMEGPVQSPGWPSVFPLQGRGWLCHSSSCWCSYSLKTDILIGLFLLLTTLWSVDRRCCVDDYSPPFQNAVCSLLPITVLHWDESWDILCQAAKSWGEIPPLHPMLCCWTGPTPILVIKLGHPSSSPLWRKRANIPGSFHPISVN